MHGWFEALTAHPVAFAMLVLPAIAATGLALGGVKLRGISLGAAGALFAGIAAGHCGVRIDPAVLEFVREFGLILFVYTIGLQLGPGIFASLRAQGARLLPLCALAVLVATLLAAGAVKLFNLDPAAVLGVLAGATTNTPSLGAAQQTLKSVPEVPVAHRGLPALGYALAYPFGIAGALASLVLLRALFRIEPESERAVFEAHQREGIEPLERRNLAVATPGAVGRRLDQLPSRSETGVVISRVLHAGESEVRAATRATMLGAGDVILAVGTRAALDRFQPLVGPASPLDLMRMPAEVAYTRVVVTQREVLGRTLRELGMDLLHGVNVTRVSRGGVELTAVPDLRLEFGDSLQVVGEPAGLERAALALGNSVRALNETQFVPFFAGLAAGVLLGLLPIPVPGLPVPVRLGMAGGPLLAALALGRLGRIGPLVCHMPLNANHAFRELGLTLFLACVGLRAGETFFATVFSAAGLQLLPLALALAMLPSLMLGILGRAWSKLDFVTLSGVLAGGVTNPPALAFAGSLCKSEGPALAYATVFPFVLLLRVLAMQLLALLFYA